MKRALVDYADDDDDDDDNHRAQQPKPRKQKKLPSLSETFLPSMPVDEPHKHQGRTRTTPFVQGQYCAHVYIPLEVGELEEGFRYLMKRAKGLCPTLHSLLDPPAPPPTDSLEPSNPLESQDTDSAIQELHISLTRPIFLRSSERAAFLASVRSLLSSHKSFELSLATLAGLENDHRTRGFLVAEVGAGFAELQALTTSLEPAITALRQETYYSEPRYHVSLGWALLGPSTPSSALSPSGDEQLGANLHTTNSAPKQPQKESNELSDHPTQNGTLAKVPVFPTIPRLPPTLIPTLQAEYGNLIRQAIPVGEVRVRIGKEEVRVRLK
ncbi:hypothetical protein DACRYDRAFT_115389 [Dacryopinax primogenitus]|uniref:U6 snRNA phosphodiesterase 1 n=1 Tax=Dacryopinax primogenitus (strain DJM 731) TaxID=1858805 RepID=M5GAY2_DACPD|nr:uncharacterized protein DACRYDRAFT_115389 [Dacryopinax primogenitus]EJU03142.1 hypothetical protein DACRYDRAFT_115389 [Dacryopinax primogenitus]